jgi:putative hydrolase of HD superfamily
MNDRGDAKHHVEHESASLARYVYEMGHLKATPRTGWTLAGIDQPESVADHVFRTALIGFILAKLEGADPHKTASLCVFHDSAETRVGDIRSVGKKYFPAVSETDVVRDQVSGLPAAIADAITALVDDYKDRSSREAVLARDADKVECLAQALEYVASGAVQANAWIDVLTSSLVSQSAIDLAEALRAAEPARWWRRFVEGYRGSAADVSNL